MLGIGWKQQQAFETCHGERAGYRPENAWGGGM